MKKNRLTKTPVYGTGNRQPHWPDFRPIRAVTSCREGVKSYFTPQNGDNRLFYFTSGAASNIICALRNW